MKIIKDIPHQFACPDCALRSSKSCQVTRQELGLPDCIDGHLHFEEDEGTANLDSYYHDRYQKGQDNG